MKTFKKDVPSVFNFWEQRLFGLITIAQGIVMIIMGKYAPSWTLKYAMYGAMKAMKAARKNSK